MVLSDEIKDMAIASEPEAEIARVAREQGMLTLREDGLSKARAGITSIEEVARVAT
jgi:type IV pilus assembly protein PilB